VAKIKLIEEIKA
jgi:hypothetical protein